MLLFMKYCTKGRFTQLITFAKLADLSFGLLYIIEKEINVNFSLNLEVTGH